MVAANGHSKVEWGNFGAGIFSTNTFLANKINAYSYISIAWGLNFSHAKICELIQIFYAIIYQLLHIGSTKTSKKFLLQQILMCYNE